MSIEFYVASDGRDTYAGTEKRPFATFSPSAPAARSGLALATTRKWRLCVWAAAMAAERMPR